MAARSIRRLTALAVILALSGCSHTSKKTAPELSKMEGKKVALVEVVGAETERSVVEVALINQLTRNGTFIIIPKEDVQAARVQFQQDPSDWKGIARRAGADYALKARVLQFDAKTNVGYSEEKVDDSLLAEETGEGETERLYKVKSLTGTIKVELQFANLADGTVRMADAEKTDKVFADEREGAAHLPPPLGFLEKLCNEAFQDFFAKYQ